MVIKDNYYPLKVWITTMIVAPIIQVIFLNLYEASEDGFWVSLLATFAIMFLEGLFSFPSFILFYLLFFGLNSTVIPIRLLKFLFALVCFCLFFTTLYLVLNWRGLEEVNYTKISSIVVIYITCIVGSVVCYGRNKDTAVK